MENTWLRSPTIIISSLSDPGVQCYLLSLAPVRLTAISWAVFMMANGIGSDLDSCEIEGGAGKWKEWKGNQCCERVWGRLDYVWHPCSSPNQDKQGLIRGTKYNAIEIVKCTAGHTSPMFWRQLQSYWNPMLPQVSAQILIKGRFSFRLIIIAEAFKKIAFSSDGKWDMSIVSSHLFYCVLVFYNPVCTPSMYNWSFATGEMSMKSMKMKLREYFGKI